MIVHLSICMYVPFNNRTLWYTLFLNKKFFSNWKRLSFRRVWLSNIIIQCSDSLTETNVYFTTYYGTTFKLQYLHNAQGTVFTPLSFQSVLVVQKKKQNKKTNKTKQIKNFRPNTESLLRYGGPWRSLHVYSDRNSRNSWNQRMYIYCIIQYGFKHCNAMPACLDFQFISWISILRGFSFKFLKNFHSSYTCQRRIPMYRLMSIFIISCSWWGSMSPI